MSYVFQRHNTHKNKGDRPLKSISLSDRGGNWVLTAFDYVTTPKEKLKRKKDSATTLTPSQTADQSGGAGAVAPHPSSSASEGKDNTFNPNSDNSKRYEQGNGVILKREDGTSVRAQIVSEENEDGKIEVASSEGAIQGRDRVVSLTREELDQMYQGSFDIDSPDASSNEETQLSDTSIDSTPASPTPNSDSPIGRPMTEEEAVSFVDKMTAEAEEAPELELTAENWDKEFGDNGVVDTPIGQVHMGEHQFLKMMRQGRNSKLGMIKPTLTNPDIIIEDTSREASSSERSSSYIFAKSFKGTDGERIYYFTSITVSQDGNEVVISNQERRKNRILSLMNSGNILYQKSNSLHPKAQVGESVPLNESLSVTNADNNSDQLGIHSSAGASESKGSNNVANIKAEEEGSETVISNQERAKGQIAKMMKDGSVLWMRTDNASETSDVAQGLYSPQGNQLSDPTSEGTVAPQSLPSEYKDTTLSAPQDNTHTQDGTDTTQEALSDTPHSEERSEEHEWDELSKQVGDESARKIISSDISDLEAERKKLQKEISKPKGQTREEKIQYVIGRRERLQSIDAEIEGLQRVLQVPQVRIAQAEAQEQERNRIKAEEARRKVGKRAVTLVLPSSNGDYLGVSSSGNEDIKGIQKRELLWEEGAKNITPATETASANVPTPSATQGGMTGGSAKSNQSNSLSADKGSEKTTEETREEKKARISQAERNGTEGTSEPSRTRGRSQTDSREVESEYSVSTSPAEKGGNFIQNKEGSIDLVQIKQEVFDALGIPAVPFRMTESMAQHVLEQHSRELKITSIEEAVAFVLNVMQNFDHVRKGDLPNTYIFSIENARRKVGKRAVTLVLPSSNGDYLGVSSSGNEDIKGIQKRELLWEEGAKNITPTTETASANVPSPSATQGGMTGGSAKSNQSNSLFADKGSEKTTEETREEKKARISQAERNGTEGTSEPSRTGGRSQTDSREVEGEKPTFLDVIRTLYEKGKEVASKLFGRSYFDVADTSNLLKKLGLTGDKFTIRYGVISRHFGKDAQHKLPLSVWSQLPKALNTPLIVTKYYTDKTKTKQKGYRIYTAIQLEDGAFVVAGVEVKNAGRNLEVNAIDTVFGRNNIIGTQEEIVYESKEMTPEQRTLLDGHNPHRYSTTQESANASDSKGSEKTTEETREEKKARISQAEQEVEELQSEASSLRREAYQAMRDYYESGAVPDMTEAQFNGEARYMFVGRENRDELTLIHAPGLQDILSQLDELANKIRWYKLLIRNSKKVLNTEQNTEGKVENEDARKSEDNSTEGIRFRRSQELQEVNDRFNEQLEVLNEETANSTILSLGSPSNGLLSAGVIDKPMRLYGNKVIKKMKKHGFSLSELRDLPRAVANPIAVFNNYGKDGSRSILTELQTEQGNFLVAIGLGNGTDVEFNIVRSTFGKGKEQVVDWLNSSYATYINKEKALEYLRTPTLIMGAISNQELSDATKVIKEFKNPSIEEKSSDLTDGIRFRRGQELQEVNERFNEELQAQIDGTLPKGHVYSLGMPSAILKSAGIPNLPIELSAERLEKKASISYSSLHPFNLSDITNLPQSLANPIAVFNSRTKQGAKVILTELKDKRGNNFVVALQVRESEHSRKMDVEVNDVRSLYPKDRVGGIIGWINQGLLTWVDRKKATEFLSTQEPNYLGGGNQSNSLSDATKVIKEFENPSIEENAFDDNILFRGRQEVNERFNEQLQAQIDGTLPKGHVYSLGMPSAILKSAGIPNLPIELTASRVSLKNGQEKHPFPIKILSNLPQMLQKPIAVFHYGDKAMNVIVEIEYEGRDLLVGLVLNQDRNGIEIHSVRGLFPKDTAKWLNWITQGKAIYLNKEIIQTKITQQRTNLADVDHLNLDDLTKVIKEFENPSIEENAFDDDILFRGRQEVNERFNEELQAQIDGTLPKGHVYSLGIPSDILQSAGIPNFPIELTASRVSLKGIKKNIHSL